MSHTLGIAPTALSFHLKALSHAGQMAAQREGRHLIDRASFPLMNDLLGFLTAHGCQGLACLEVSTKAEDTKWMHEAPPLAGAVERGANNGCV